MNRSIVECPSTNFRNIVDVLTVLEQSPEINVEQIALLSKKGKSVISNAVPLAIELQLIERSGRRRGKLFISNSGSQLLAFLKTNDKQKINELALNILLPRSKILNEAYKVIKNEPGISSDNLGKKIHSLLNINKPWKERTYSTVGKTCRYILDGLELVPYGDEGKKQVKRQHRGRFKNKLYPSTSVDNVFEIVDTYFKMGNSWKITHPDQQESKKQSLLYQVSSLIDLGLAEYIDHENDIIKLTEAGIRIQKTTDRNERKKIFQEILFDYPPIVDILKMLYHSHNDFGFIEVGNILERYNNCHWSDSSKKSYGTKLISWLLMGDIIVEDQWGKYSFTSSFLNNETLFPIVHIIPEPDVTKKIFVKSDIQKNETLLSDINSYINIINRLCNWILHTDNNEWYANEVVKEEILSNIDSLTNQFKLSGKSIRSLTHMKHWIEAGYEMKQIKYIENCLQLLVEIDHDNKLKKK